ncbi:hypothetical protein BAPKO_2552 (plasmid) [Borreliella afzelii PKo]|uniref:hypothetical protein n=1 Tax=Borreliella afzelii TaxID=29518 RepID=UPI0000DB929D|nr:hypothetical protein BAPKO_2552 [Borreliella afzelii PKo]
MKNKNIINLLFLLLMTSCELYSIIIGSKLHFRSITIDKRKVNFMLEGVSKLNNSDDETVYKNFKEKIKTLKIDLKYAINADEIEEKFLILESLFQEKLTTKLNALKATRADIGGLLVMIDDNYDNFSYIQTKARSAGISIYLAQDDTTTKTDLQKRAMKQIYKDRIQERYDYIDQTIKHLEEN